MWRRAAAKLLSVRSAASSPWSARLPSSGNLSTKRQDVFPLPIATGHEPEPEPAVMKTVPRPKPVVATPIFSGIFSLRSEPDCKNLRKKTGYSTRELVGGDIVDFDFINGPFGTEEKPAVMRSWYDHQIAGCCGREGALHDPQLFWLRTGTISVCPLCPQHFTLECVGGGGYPPKEY